MAFPRDGQSLASLKSPVSSVEDRDFGIPAGSESLLDSALFDRNLLQ